MTYDWNFWFVPPNGVLIPNNFHGSVPSNWILDHGGHEWFTPLGHQRTHLFAARHLTASNSTSRCCLRSWQLWWSCWRGRHLVMTHIAMEKSLINGGFNGKIIFVNNPSPECNSYWLKTWNPRNPEKKKNRSTPAWYALPSQHPCGAIRGICVALVFGCPYCRSGSLRRKVTLPGTKKLWKMTINSGFSHEKWWFSIAMFNYQRVYMGLSPDFADKESRITVFFHINKPSHLGTSGGKGSISSGNVGCSDCCATSTFKEWPEKHRKWLQSRQGLF